MKRTALSIRQPWATLVVHGLKTIEVRSWQTRVRGEIFIHTGRSIDRRPEAWDQTPMELVPFTRRVGGLIGRVRLLGCRTYDSQAEFARDQEQHRCPEHWFRPPRYFGFLLADPETIPFEPMSGKLLFFEAPEEVER